MNEELKIKVEEMELKLKLAKIQAELNDYAPSQYMRMRCKCPRCGANYESDFDASYYK